MWSHPLLRHRHAEVCPHDVQPLRLWMREGDDVITVGAHRGHDSLMSETHGVRAAALVCQLARRLCESKYKQLQPHLSMQLARRGINGSMTMADVDEMMSGLGAMSVSTLSKLALEDEVRRSKPGCGGCSLWV